MSKLGIGTGITPDDGNGDSLLDGAVKVNSNFNEIYSYFGDGSDLTSGSWQKVTSGINTTLNVGIGTTNPRFALEVGAVGSSGTTLYVNGDARVTGILTVGSSSITLDGSSNTIKVGTGVTIYGNTGIISATDFYASGLQVGVLTASTIIYEGSVLQSYWSETSAGINTLSNVGIGTTNPTVDLEVGPVGSSSTSLLVNGRSLFKNFIKLYDGISFYNDLFDTAGATNNISVIAGVTKRLIFRGNTIDKFSFSHYYGGFDHYVFEIAQNGDVNTTGNLNVVGITTLAGIATAQSTLFANQLSVSGVSTFSNRLDVDETIYLGTLGGNAEFRISRFGGINKFESINGPFGFFGGDVDINNNLNVSGVSTFIGSVGIGTTNATEKLTVRGGDISVGVDTSTGLILTSPNGTQYRLIVDDSGTLSTTTV